MNQALRALLCKAENYKSAASVWSKLIGRILNTFIVLYDVIALKNPPPPKKCKHMAHQEGKQSNLGSTCRLEG